jgi:hypothetical protein
MKNVVAVFYCFSLLFGLFSCESRTEPFVLRHYYNNGKLQEEIEMNADTIPNGNWTQYFESGVLKSRFTYVDGIKNGAAELYYPSGNLQQSGSYYDKRRIGKVSFHSDLPNKPVIAESNYINVGGKEYPNDAIQYDEAGIIIGRTPQVSFNQRNDSLIIKMTYPEMRSMRVVIGDFDSLYSIRDKKSLDTVFATRHLIASIDIKRKFAKGELIRGMVQNYETSTENTFRNKIRVYYFGYVVK